MIARLIIIFLLFTSFHLPTEDPYIVVLGTAQDAGYPQIGCNKACCKKVYEKKATRQKVSCLALFDPSTNQKWIFDATPDFTDQLKMANNLQPGNISGIFLTHAHIGHYTGLMYLGREAMNANSIQVYAMPRLFDFLQHNGPWSQLVEHKNIRLQRLKSDSSVKLTSTISVTPLLVPHRDEFSETVGFSIKAGNKSVLFIPDIDKWQKWNKDIQTLIGEYDYMFIDGTFYKDGELPGRNMSEIPHPFVEETVSLLNELEPGKKQKIVFIHFNHTNPLLDPQSSEFSELKRKGFGIATEGMRIKL